MRNLSIKGYLKWNQKPNKVIVFWDSCMLLDILRIPVRTDGKVALYYREILDLADSKKIDFVASRLSWTETSVNYNQLSQELKDYANNTRNNLTKYYQTISGLGRDYFIAVKNDINGEVIQNNLADLYNNMFVPMTLLQERVEYMKQAHYRVGNHYPPAKQKGEYKDCFIWMTFLDLAKQLSPGDAIFFMTANTADYCEINQKGVLDRLLSSDISALKCRSKVLFSIYELMGELHSLAII